MALGIRLRSFIVFIRILTLIISIFALIYLFIINI